MGEVKMNFNDEPSEYERIATTIENEIALGTDKDALIRWLLAHLQTAIAAKDSAFAQEDSKRVVRLREEFARVCSERSRYSLMLTAIHNVLAAEDFEPDVDEV